MKPLASAADAANPLWNLNQAPSLETARMAGGLEGSGETRFTVLHHVLTLYLTTSLSRASEVSHA